MSILILSNPTFQLALMTNELPCLCVCVSVYVCVCVCVREREREREKRGCYAYTHYRSHHFLHTWSYIVQFALVFIHMIVTQQAYR